MGAVKNRRDLDKPDRMAARYGGVPVIYVESDEDHYIYGECWFKECLSRVEFKPATSQCGFGGCSAVTTAVGKERAAGNSAWGIVDRDVVMSRDLWNLVHETDDAQYERTQPFGAKIKVLRRWEIENYLVDAIALEKCQAELNCQPSRPDQDVIQEILDHCQALVPHAAITATYHEFKKNAPGDGCTNKFATRTDVDTNIRSTMFSSLPSTAVGRYNHHIPLVDAFDIANGAPKDRVTAMLRRVNGKAMLQRFSFAHKIQNINIKGLLANRIKENNRVPEEIIRFIEEVAK